MRTVIGLCVAGAVIVSLTGGAARSETSGARPAASGPRSEATQAPAGRPPIVLVIFDALSPTMLQDASGNIDAVRYPNFAAFAKTATWYRNASTVSESTRFSIPALLDGRFPRPKTREDWTGHPRSIYTALRGRYRINNREDASAVCPPALCRPLVAGSVIERLKHGRVGRFRATLRAISNGAKPQLTVLHTLITHEPRQYLPDGRHYLIGGSPDAALDGTGSYHRRFLTHQSVQRALLQLQYADRLLGELVARLRKLGLWERAAVALVSDHGESFIVKKTPAKPFEKGKLTYRRAVSRSNIDRIANVALFVKYPRQSAGKVDRRFVRTIDLSATLYRLGGASTRGLDGRSLRDRRYRGQRRVAVRKQEGRWVTMAAKPWERRLARLRGDLIARFGSAGDNLFAWGARPAAHGRPLTSFEQVRRSRLRATVLDVERFGNVRGSFVPAHVVGRLRGARAGGRTLALALNGVVVATVPTYPPLGTLRFSFSAMLPPAAFKPGRNELAVFEMVGAALRPL